LKAQRAAGLDKAGAAMIGGKSQAMLHGVFKDWGKGIQIEKRERTRHQIATLEKQCSKFQAKEAKVLGNLGGNMMGGKVLQFLGLVYHAWRALKVELLHGKELEKARSELLELKAKQTEGLEKMGGAMLAGVGGAMLHKVVQDWSAAVKEEILERKEHEFVTLQRELKRYAVPHVCLIQ